MKVNQIKGESNLLRKDFLSHNLVFYTLPEQYIYLCRLMLIFTKAFNKYCVNQMSVRLLLLHSIWFWEKIRHYILL